MNKIDLITELETKVVNANTAEVNGRQIVADSCKKLYNIMEEDVYNAGSEWMLKGLYSDLCSGNFAEPFACEMKKQDFAIAKKVYIDEILTRI